MFYNGDYKTRQGVIMHKRGYSRNTENANNRICNTFVTVL